MAYIIDAVAGESRIFDIASVITGVSCSVMSRCVVVHASVIFYDIASVTNVISAVVVVEEVRMWRVYVYPVRFIL